MIFILLLLSLIGYLFCKKAYLTIINPVAIFWSVNILSIFLSVIQTWNFKYSLDTCIIVCVMFFSFLLGIVIGKKKFRFPKRSDGVYPSRRFLNLIIIVSIIYDIAVIFYIYKLFSTYSLIEFYLNLNEVNAYVQSDEYEIEWYHYLVPIGMPLMMMCLYYLKYYKKNWLIIIQCGACLLYCVSPRRENLFNLIIVLLFFVLSINQDSNKFRLNKKKILKIGFCIVSVLIIIMSITQEALNKKINETINIEGIELPSTLTEPWLYTSLNYPHFQKQDQNIGLPQILFLSSGRVPYLFINKIFKTNIDANKEFQLDIVNIEKYTTNTMPLLFYAILDLGCFFFIDFIIIGFISQQAYYALHSVNLFSRILGAMWFALLTLSFRSYLLIYLNYDLSILYTIIIALFIKKVKISK